MRNIIRKTLLLFTLFAAVTGIYAQNSPESMEPLTEKLYNQGFGIPPQPLDAPDFTVKDLAGNPVSLSSFKGKVILLNFWATWCPPCKAEMPDMEHIYQKLKNNNFTIFAVSSLDPRETRNKVEDFIKETGYSFPVAFDDTGSTVPQFYRTGSIPTSYILNTDGKVIARLVGMYEWDNPEMISIIKELAAQ